MKEVEVNNIQNNQNRSRLRKRQAGYAKNITAFASVRPGQAFYEEKHAFLESLQTLNNSIQNQDERLDVEKMKTLQALYADAITKLNTLNRAINLKNETYKKSRSAEDEPSSIENKLTSEARQNDLLADTLAKDLKAFDAAVKKGQEKTLAEIYESSRTATYGVKKGSVKQNASGNQNSRIPLTIIDADGHEVEGFFTPDKKNSKSKSADTLIEEAIKKGIKKYGSVGADLFSAERAKYIYDYISTNGEVFGGFLSEYKELCLGDNNKMRNFIAVMNQNSPVDMAELLDSREKFNAFIGIMHDAAKVDNARGILDGVDLADQSRLNRRNTAMSKMADILGVPNVIARSENVKVKIGGKTFKGTFMKNAEGADEKNYNKEPLFMEATFESAENLKLKKCIADLQVLDYICGNPDRHAGNIMYNFKRRKDGTVVLDSIQGIDNDLAFGATDFETGVKMKSAIKLEQMNVITRSMADRIMNLTPDSLKQIFYGYEISTEEIRNMEKRLKDLQSKIKKDNLEFGKGYGKGSLLPGKIKVVEDNELEEMSFLGDLSISGSKENLFNRVQKRTNGLDNIKKAKQQLIWDYNDNLYDVTIGKYDAIDKIFNEMNSDTVMFQGNQNQYNIMLRSIKDLKKEMLSFSNPEGEKQAKGGDHTDRLRDLIEKTRAALKEVNEYIYYKNSKTTGEEWRNDPNLDDPNRIPGKTERRFKHAIEAREFLSKQMEAFEKLDEKVELIGEYSKKEIAMNKKNTDLLKQALPYTEEFNSKRKENQYQTHKTRCEYELYELHFEAVGARHEGNGAREFMENLRFDAALGFAINSLRPEDRAELRDKMSKVTGKEFGSDEELMKRSVASLMINSKLSLLKEKEKNKNKLEKADQVHLDCMKDIKLETPKNYVNDLMNSEEFKHFFEKNREDIYDLLKPEKPEIGVPGKPAMNRLIGFFGKSCLDVHPERKAAKDAQKNKNKVNNNQNNMQKNK